MLFLAFYDTGDWVRSARKNTRNRSCSLPSVKCGYCPTPFAYQRRRNAEVVVGDPAKGGVVIGGDHPVVVQSMLTCDTMDTRRA